MDQFESFSEDITKWEVLRDIVDLDLNDEFSDDSIKSGPRVQLLPRKTVNLYGNIPKMEQRIFSKCRECRLIFNPRNILTHKACMGRSHSSSSSSFDLKKKSKSKSLKKSHSNTPSPPPFKKPPSPSSPSTLSVVTDMSKVISPKASKHSSPPTASSPTNSSTSPHKPSSKISSNSISSKTNSSLILKSPKSEHSSHSSKLSKLFSNSTDSSTESTSASKSSSSSSHSSSSISSKHKKSRKSGSSNSKNVEEYNPSIHCGVIEDNKGPCTRSLSCSNHRSQLRKLVSSRSKEVHYLLNERKISKEKSTKHNSSKTHNFPNDLETKDTGESYGPISANSNTLSIILPKTNDSFLNQNSTTSNKQLLDITDLDIKFSKTAEVILNNESDAGTVPVMYMPMSPVSVVSPVEYVKIGKNIIRLETPQSATSPPITTNQSVFLGIPSNINVKMYNSHPKPITLPSFGAKKIGGAILLSKHQLELQRNNLLLAISSNVNIGSSIDIHRSSLNNSNALYKSNILKNKNTSKSNNCKRSMSEKINNSDSKQMKYSSNLNGFLIHSTISETADAPSSNMLMNDKMTFLNMK